MIKARSFRFDFDEVAQASRLDMKVEPNKASDQPLTVQTSYAQPK